MCQPATDVSCSNPGWFAPGYRVPQHERCRDVSTRFRTQSPVGFESLLRGQRGELASRCLTALAVVEHFERRTHRGLGLCMRVPGLQIAPCGLERVPETLSYGMIPTVPFPAP